MQNDKTSTLTAPVLRMTAALALAVAVGGCAMNDTAKRTGGGAALGTLAGSIIGGNREGAAIGAAVGAAGGYIYDQHSKRSDSESENARLRAENERLRQEQAAGQ